MKSAVMKLTVVVFIFVLCLSATPLFAGSVGEFKAIGSGSLTYYGPIDCQLSDAGCTVKTEGTVQGNKIGKGTFTNIVTVLWKSGFPNGSGGYCAPGSGTETIAAADGSTIEANRVGILCDVGGTYTFNGTYFITGGTKRFKGASGSGIQTCSVDSNGNVLGFANGTIVK